MKDFCLILSLSLQRINIGFDWRGGLGGGSRGGGLGFGGANGLGARVRSGWDTSGIIAFVGAVAFLPAAEAKSFFDTSRSFCRGKLGERDSIDVHSVGVMGSARGMNGRGESSSFQCKDTHFLCMEYLGLFDPFGDSGRDRRHEEDHSGKLLVKSQGKLVDKGNVVRDTCLRGKVLKVGDVLLKAVISYAVWAFKGFLGELGELEARGCLGVVGEKGGFEV